ncbi:MAG: hypothetical protein ABI411_18205 [Tahibacter sp.]
MKRTSLFRSRNAVAGFTLAVAGVLAAPVYANAAEANLDCQLRFNLTTWSAIYKHAEGSGTISCENGQSMPVTISAKGVGLTVGKSHVDNGLGKFTDVHNMAETLGDYAQAEAHAGVVKSGTAQVLSKGNVSLALSGAGEGVSLGVDVGKFTISKAGSSK